MDKEEILLKNYAILSKNVAKNKNALQSAITQLMEVNPESGLEVWERTIRENESAIREDAVGDEFEYDSVGYFLVTELENDLLKMESFGLVAEKFADNDFLMDVLFAKSPVDEYSGADYVLSYLIKNNHLDTAEKMLSALYSNERFAFHSSLWEQIIDSFQYGDTYCPSFSGDDDAGPSDEVKDFCMSWIEKIGDEEQRAAAMVYMMKLF